MPSKQSELPRLEPCTSVAGMELWSQCYERWLLPLDAPHAGPIQRLNEKLSSLSILSNRQSNGDLDAETARPAAVSRFFPFSVSRGEPRSTLDSMQVSLIDASLLLDSQSLLNAPD
ncbi:hypothetical protein MSG28_012482 [Choristoneura fumiferana]|uniref:Uncharacterized protein n=1 Tax=Choristoneura fumiferana TaxID=7141 RepID=A0ACC0KDB5_CHOFU|nr:hypothetical protein MSG28_012482 [Choristoneura fumiferana]